MTSRERCFEASFYEWRKALVFSKSLIYAIMLLQSPLVKEKNLCLPAPESDTVICERFRSAVCG